MDTDNSKKNINTSSFTQKRNLILFGICLASVIRAFVGSANDIVTVKFFDTKFNGNSRLYGLTFTAFTFGRLFTMFLFTKLSDKYGRKSMLLASFAIYTLGAFLAGIAETSTEFLIFRFIKGMSSYEGVALALINDFFHKGTRGKPITYFSAANGIGMLLGTLSGGYFLELFNFQVSYLILAILSLLSFLSIFVFVRNKNSNKSQNYSLERRINNKFILSQESCVPEVKDTANIMNTSKDIKKSTFTNLSAIYKDKYFISGLIMSFFASFLIMSVASYSKDLIINQFSVVQQNIGYYLLPILLSSIILGLSLGHRENFKKYLSIGFSILIVCFFGMSILFFEENIWIFIGFLIIINGCLGYLFPIIDNYISNFTQSKSKGALLGIYASINVIGAGVGAYITGSIADYFGTFMPFMLMGVLSILLLFISLKGISINIQ